MLGHGAIGELALGEFLLGAGPTPPTPPGVTAATAGGWRHWRKGDWYKGVYRYPEWAMSKRPQ